MALPSRRFRVAVTLFAVARKVGGGRQRPVEAARSPEQGPREPGSKGARQQGPATEKPAAPHRAGMCRADVDKAHPPRVFRLEGATWCEVKHGRGEPD